MKHLLLTLLAALALPTAVNADSVLTQKAYAASILGGNYPSFRGVLDGKMNPSYTKDEVIFLNRIDDYLKARKRYGCN